MWTRRDHTILPTHASRNPIRKIILRQSGDTNLQWSHSKVDWDPYAKCVRIKNSNLWSCFLWSTIRLRGLKNAMVPPNGHRDTRSATSGQFQLHIEPKFDVLLSLLWFRWRTHFDGRWRQQCAVVQLKISHHPWKDRKLYFYGLENSRNKCFFFFLVRSFAG